MDFEEFLKQERNELADALAKTPPENTYILQFHVYTENILEQIILAKLARGDKIIEKAKLTYFQKVCLVDSFNILEDRIIQCLFILNRIRNDCVRDRDKKLSKSDINRIGSPMGKPYSAMKQKYSENLSDLFLNTLILIGLKLVVALYNIENK